jgi:hypothetical protein
MRFSLVGMGKRPTLIPSTLLPTGVYRASTSRYCWCALTAPLHPYPVGAVRELPVRESPLHGGIFLWHYPRDRSHWELSSKSGLLGVRTFLKFASRTNLQPPRQLSCLSSLLLFDM